MQKLLGAAFLVFLVATSTVATPISAANGHIWLDTARPADWNVAARALPRAPAVDATMNARCKSAGLVRNASSAQDRAVNTAGWLLLNKPSRSGPTTIVMGQVGFDGMCRPLRYQAFVFYSGRYAGTLSPTSMPSRAPGSMQIPKLQSPTRILATFDRYATADPLCCPSRLTDVTFVITRTARGPIVAPLRARTYTEQVYVPPSPHGDGRAIIPSAAPSPPHTSPRAH